MPLPDLATLEDVEARLGSRIDDEQRARIAAALLRDASAAVRLYTGQTFTQVVDDVVMVRVRNGVGRLPQRPVTAVTAATARAFDGSQIPTWFQWDGVQAVRAYPQVPNVFAFEPFTVDLAWITVTYTHGYPDGELPPALVGIVAQIVGRALGTDLLQSGVQSETIAGYSYTLGAAAAAGGFGLLPNEKSALDYFRRQASATTVGP